MSESTEVVQPDAEVQEHPAFAALRAENVEKSAELNRLGAYLSPVDVIATQLETWVNLLAPPGSVLRGVYDMQVEHNLGLLLDQAISQKRRENLTEGVTLELPPGLG